MKRWVCVRKISLFKTLLAIISRSWVDFGHLCPWSDHFNSQPCGFLHGICQQGFICMCLCVRVRESQVLFLAGKTKGCFYAPPYLDDYGETDQGLRYISTPDVSHTWLFLTVVWDQVLCLVSLRRGNPLHLCQERYRKIQKLWRQHSITEEIGHAQEANQTLVGIDWQHLWSHMTCSYTCAHP